MYTYTQSNSVYVEGFISHRYVVFYSVVKSITFHFLESMLGDTDLETTVNQHKEYWAI